MENLCTIHQKGVSNLICDNDCQTVIFECNCEYYIKNNQLIQGHDPMCGVWSDDEDYYNDKS